MIITLGRSLSDIQSITQESNLVVLVHDIIKKVAPNPETIVLEKFHVYKFRYHNEHNFAAVIGCWVRWKDELGPQRKKIFLGASSNDSKLRAYQNLTWLRHHGFDQPPFRVTRPLCYITDLQMLVYEASEGQTLYWHIKKSPSANELRWPLNVSARWLLKLHQLDATSLTTVAHYDAAAVLRSLQALIPKYQTFDSRQGEKLQKVLSALHTEIEGQREFSNLVYGDFHPENIIVRSLSTRQLTMIDLSDMSLGDPWRDVGTFIQQFDFMSQRFLARKDINDLKRYFIECYSGKPWNSLTIDEICRLNTYQALTAVRSSAWLMEPESQKVSLELLNDALLLMDKVARRQLSIHLR